MGGHYRLNRTELNAEMQIKKDRLEKDLKKYGLTQSELFEQIKLLENGARQAINETPA